MVSLLNVSLCAALAVLFWSCLGFALAQRLFPRALMLPVAPVLGWAVQNAASLPIFLLAGFSTTLVVALALLALAAGIYAISAQRRAFGGPSVEMPAWAYGLAALLAVIPTLAILPKETGDGVVLAGPMFDHAKAAIIDDMARLGLPPGNPFFGAAGDRLAYYYLWYFGAAQFARVLGISGWEADVAMTWFTAFASLTLMMGLAAWLSRRAFATLWVGLFALAASLRFPLWILLGTESVNGLVLARHRPRRLALSGKLGAPASDGGGLRRAGDPADGSARLRALGVDACHVGAGRCRGFRKFDLDRRGGVRSGGANGCASFARAP